jgi:glycerol-3-phosphate acyltransferase PlsX
MRSPGKPDLTIAVDAAGGDHAPGVVVEGAVAALREERDARFSVALVGEEAAIRRELRRLPAGGLALRIVDAPERVEMSDAAAAAVRRKRNSSIAAGIAMLAEGSADAFVSAGHTGAVVAASLLRLGRLPGVLRPAIATVVPGFEGACVLLDVGANAECKPQHLAQFAALGAVYARRMLGVESPRIALLNMGEEPNRGNEIAQGGHALLAHSPLNFVGNVEGRDVFRGVADVVVCDGFTGNIVLKFAESVLGMVADHVRREVLRDARSRLGAFLLTPALERLRARLDAAEVGGAPLLGVDGVCIIAHGSSSAKAIKNAVKVAARFVRLRINQDIRLDLERRHAEFGELR